MAMQKCPFCERHAVTKNSQDVPVCILHKSSSLQEIKCLCGNILEIRSGKFGSYYNCISCGNISVRKAWQISPAKKAPVKAGNTVTPTHTKENKDKEAKEKDRPKEIVIRSDDPLYFS